MSTDPWIAGYYVGATLRDDSAPIALDKIRARLDQCDYWPYADQMPSHLVTLLTDLQAILDTAKEPHV